MTKLIRVARLGAAHGLKGEVKLTCFTEDPQSLIAYGDLQSATGQLFRVERLKPAKNGFMATLQGIRDRTAAEGLTNLELFVPRERLPEPEEGFYYQADLIGLDLETTTGQALGKVEGMVDFGGGDLLEVRMPGREETVLIPFKGADVDLGRGRIRLAIPEGLLED